MTNPMGTAAPNANKMVNADTSNVDKVGVFYHGAVSDHLSRRDRGRHTIWKVLGNVKPEWGDSNRVIPIALALLFGLIIYLTSVTKGTGWRERISGFLIAFANSGTIAAAVLGIEGAAASTPPQ